MDVEVLNILMGVVGTGLFVGFAYWWIRRRK